MLEDWGVAQRVSIVPTRKMHPTEVTALRHTNDLAAKTTLAESAETRVVCYQGPS